MTQQVVRTRMAPSPTGDVHVGTIATLLKNYAFAKKHGGKFILRIEDTDKVREVEDGVNKIMSVVRNYGLSWDEGPDVGGQFAPYIQSERLPLYKKAAEQLVAAGKAYYCFCSRERLEEVRATQQANHQPPRYDRHCRNLSVEEVEARRAAGEPHVIRLRVPDNQDITFTDWIRGDISFNSNEIDDQVLMKSDGYPTYHLAVVVDDHDMQITHVMRAEEWISSTPKHILLYQAFAWQLPIFAHVPVLLNPNGKGKMSKRHGPVGAQHFLDQGYLPEAMLNFLMILGWSPADQREILTLDEYIAEFDPRDLNPKPVAFDMPKLNWLNGVHIRKLPKQDLLTRLQPHIPANFPIAKLEPILDLVVERLVILSDFAELTSFFYQTPTIDKQVLLKKADATLVATQLEQTLQVLTNNADWSELGIETVLRQLQEKYDWHRSQYFMMLRWAVTGKAATPPLFSTMAQIDKSDCLSRLQTAWNLVK